MSHFLTFVTDGNGVVIDPLMPAELKAAMAGIQLLKRLRLLARLVERRDRRRESYNRFSIGLVTTVRLAAAAGRLTNVPVRFWRSAC